MDLLRACLVKVRVKPFGILGYAEDQSLIALFDRKRFPKLRQLPHKNSSHEAVSRVKEADLAPPSPNETGS
jgi:hypothetical protein